jgi:hypothetical protein
MKATIIIRHVTETVFTATVDAKSQADAELIAEKLVDAAEWGELGPLAKQGATTENFDVMAVRIVE